MLPLSVGSMSDFVKFLVTPFPVERVEMFGEMETTPLNVRSVRAAAYLRNQVL